MVGTAARSSVPSPTSLRSDAPDARRSGTNWGRTSRAARCYRRAVVHEGVGTERPSATVAETRRRVLDAAADLVDRVSYRSVTIDAVARASGVSKSTIYRHWPSRQVLVLEAYTLKTNRSTAVPDTGDALGDLRQYVLALAGCLGP